MHPFIAAAHHTAQPWHLSQIGAIATALVTAAVIVLVFKIIGRIFAPRKPRQGSRPSAPYAGSRR